MHPQTVMVFIKGRRFHDTPESAAKELVKELGERAAEAIVKGRPGPLRKTWAQVAELLARRGLPVGQLLTEEPGHLHTALARDVDSTHRYVVMLAVGYAEQAVDSAEGAARSALALTRDGTQGATQWLVLDRVEGQIRAVAQGDFDPLID